MNWLSLFLQSKSIKASGIAVGSSGVVALLLGVIDHKDKSIREMVDLKNKTIMTKIDNIETGQGDIKKMLIRIDERLYYLHEDSKKNNK
jgi:hypothetical protein